MQFADISEDELDHPTWKTVLKLIRNTGVLLFKDRVGIVLGSAFFLLMVWGPKGTLPLLKKVTETWQPSCVPGVNAGCTLPRLHQMLPVAWDQEWMTFLLGFALLVAVPMLIIKFVLKQRWSDYGLGLPPRDRWGLTGISALLLFLPCVVLFWFAAQDPDMQREYPLYHGHFASLGQFALFELGYLVFFIVIEFTFRGYLLFGLYRTRDVDSVRGVPGAPGPLVFGTYSVFLSMLSYTAWHLGKPVAEAWGTLAWGIATGAIVLATGTIWHVVLVHWLLNVFLDYLILMRHGGPGIG